MADSSKFPPIQNYQPQKVTKVFALGGLEEIGKNTYCIKHDHEIIIIDAGVKFVDQKELKVNAVIIPDYQYLQDNNNKIKALFITHGHEDHIGGIPFLIQQVRIPIIYAPRLACSLIRNRLEEMKLTHKTIIKEYTDKTMIRSRFFRITFFPVNHSIPDAYGVSVQTPHGQIVSTGDYKFDLTPLGHEINFQTLSYLASQKVHLLLADSTNSEVPGHTITEQIVIKNIVSLISQASGRVFLTTFASNVHRLLNIVQEAVKLKRKILILGRSLQRIIRIIRENGLIKISSRDFASKKNISQHKPKKLLIICTGSQGEEAAVLWRIASDNHTIKMNPEDTVIMSSSAIPSNKADIEAMVNKMVMKQVHVIENKPTFPIHTSGHASCEDQKLMLRLLQPKFFMPMHGDFRMLKKHAETAIKTGVKPENVFICANGDVVTLHQNHAEVTERIKVDSVMVEDRTSISHETKAIIFERQQLSKNGIIIVVVNIDFTNRMMIGNPKVISRGTFYVKTSGYVISKTIQISAATVNLILQAPRPTERKIKVGLITKLAPYFYAVKRRNPVIVPLILAVKAR